MHTNNITEQAAGLLQTLYSAIEQSNELTAQRLAGLSVEPYVGGIDTDHMHDTHSNLLS